MKDDKELKKVIVKAPGKLMLMGEHAVVYGYPCIVSTVNKYLTIEGEIIDERTDQLITPDVTDQRFLIESLRCFRSVYKIKKSVRLTTKSELGKYGLGSSAATVVATLKVLAILFDVHVSEKEIFEMGLKVVLSIQGKASGFDIAASIYGGTLYFNGKTKEVIPISQEALSLIVIFSGIKADTVSMIGLVNQKRENYKKGVENIFENIEKLVLEAKSSLFEKDWKRFGTLMNYNQNYLEDLGVSTEKLNMLILSALKVGAYGAKISGAGGGDCVIVCASYELRSKVNLEIQNAGGEVLDIIVGTGKLTCI